MKTQLLLRWLLSAGLAAGFVGPASAGPCTLNAVGQQCIVQWDLSALAGPLDVERILFSPGSGTATYAWYDGLNATGALGPSGGPGSLMDALTRLNGREALFDDGRFSVLFTAVTSSFIVPDISFYLTNGSQTLSGAGSAPPSTPTVPTPPTNPVPAPATWALALAGLAGLASTRRRIEARPVNAA